MKRFTLSLIFVLGMASSAFALTTGYYNLNIMITPTSVSGTNTITNWGVNGNWQSSFSFGITPGAGSQVMPDLTSDGYAGVVGIYVDGSGNVSVTSFQKDDIPGTAGGTFGQFGTITGMGSNPGTSLNLDPTGRLGSVSSFPSLYGSRWDYDDVPFYGPALNAYQPITTGTATQPTVGTLAGKPIFTNSAGTFAVLVSAGSVGSDWGGFWGATFAEIWRVKITAGTPPIPEPASLLLIGSGLVGLIGIARRKNK